MHEHRVAARHERHHGGRLEVRRADLVRVQVALKVIHADERLAGAPSRALRERDAHHERTHEAGRVGDGHGVEV